MLDDRPWSALPKELASALRPEIPDVANEIIEEIRRGVPDYAGPLEGPFAAGMRTGVEQALERFVDLIEFPERPPESTREVYVELGRGEMRAGRRLEALLAAYRLGARVAWRRIIAEGEAAALRPQTIYVLAESIFAYVDELSSESVEGYAMEQAAAAGESQRRRRRLAALLVQGQPVDDATVKASALEAGWDLPAQVAALYVEGEDPDRLALHLGVDVIATSLVPGTCALIPDPDAPGRRAQLEAVFAARLGALGPTVPWREASISVGRARAAYVLAREGALGGEVVGLVEAERHPVALLMGLDRRLARDISAAALAPMQEETPASRGRLLETLAAWLRHQGRTERVAEALHVHPQTVRYRMGRLRELYGERLDDPDVRFELELALRAVPDSGG